MTIPDSNPFEGGLPVRTRGRPNTISIQRHEERCRRWADGILKIHSRLDFQVSSRGWCYILENHGAITKGIFDAAQGFVNDCRKNGFLPLDVCAEDERRATDGVEELDADIPGEIDRWVKGLIQAPDLYLPISFWDNQEYYIEVIVEKVDLKNLFAPVCAEFHVPITNVGGWADLHSRATMMRHFAEHEDAGRQCVALICTDHDPGGLNIADSFRKNLEEMANAVGWHPDNLIIDHFGLHYDFIDNLGLTWIDNLESGSGKQLNDPNHKDHNKRYVQEYIQRFGVRKCEANALVIRPQEGRELCRRQY